MEEVLNMAFRAQVRSMAAHAGCQGRTGSPGLLHGALDAAQAFGPAFDGAMSNHLPMALHAAWEMGADAPRLQQLVDHERRKLEPAASVPPTALADARRAAERRRAGEGLGNEWLKHRGQPGGYGWLQAYFAALLEGQRAADVLAAHLPVLLQSPHAFAFHGLIRTAHAVEAGHRAELASALATWAAWWELLPPGARSTEALDPATWALTLRGQARGWRSELPMIIYRMRSAAQAACYADLAERLAPAASLAERRTQLLVVAREAYLHSRNFTVLHLITGLRALRVLLPALPSALDPQPLIAVLDRAAVAGWLAGRVQWQDVVPERLPRSWPELHARALAQSDEHVIKGVHACWQEDLRAPHPQWQLVADRMLETSA